MANETIMLEKHNTNSKKDIDREAVEAKENGFFAPEKRGINNGVLGGLIMITIAITWFVIGYAMGIIFLYPPILLLIGIYACLKGAVTGNLCGRRNSSEKL